MDFTTENLNKTFNTLSGIAFAADESAKSQGITVGDRLRACELLLANMRQFYEASIRREIETESPPIGHAVYGRYRGSTK